MKYALRVGLLVILMVSLIGFSNGSAAVGKALPGGKPVVTPFNGGVLLDWQVPEVEIKSNAAGETEVRIPGVEQEQVPGQAQLPVASLLVALPPSGTPTIAIHQKELRAVKPAGKMAIEPRVKQVKLGNGSTVEVDAAPQDVKPFELVSLEEIGIQRGVRLARLVIHPVMPEGGQLKAYAHLKFALNFNAPLSPSAAGNDAMLQQVQRMVINPSQMQTTLDTAAPAQALPLAVPASPAPVMVMELKDTGLYQVTYDALNTAGFFAAGSVNPLKIHITHAGQEVAYELFGDNGNTTFDATESIRFIARPRFNRWSNYDTYFLSVLDTDGTRMTSRSATPSPTITEGTKTAEKTFEQNLLYTPDQFIPVPIDPGRDGDVWMWDQLPGLTTRNYYFDLSSVDTAQAGTLRVFLNGYVTMSHNVRISLNDSLLGTAVWDGKTAFASQVNIPATKLKSTGNKLTLNLPNTTDGVWLDAFKVQYRLSSASGDVPFYGEASTTRIYTVNVPPASALVYNITNEHTPVALTGFTPGTTSITFQDTSAGVQPFYLATSNIRPVSVSAGNLRQKAPLLTAGTTRANYLIISHPQFLAGVGSLADYRRSAAGGFYMVATENAQAIYDAYAQGIPNPQAIQDYLKAVYQSWLPKPQYVTLVGDGTWDPKQYLSNSTPTFIPPFVKQVDAITYEEAAENRFATLDGGSDILADMMIGRLPVNSASQLSGLISKIINYETTTTDDGWKIRGTVAADVNYSSYGLSIFQAMDPNPFVRQQIFYKVNYPTITSARTALINAWNSGTSILAYTGHSTFHQWGVDNLFHISNVSSLQNGAKLPVVLELTCDTSRFHLPGETSLDEALVLHPAGGAIVTYGSSTASYPPAQVNMMVPFIQSMQAGGGTAGQAMMAAKTNLLTNGVTYDDYMADIFLLLGDPAVYIKMKMVYNTISTYLPAVQK